MKRKRSREERAKRRTRRLAPLETQSYAGNSEVPPEDDREDGEGVMRVTTGSLRVPSGLSTEGADSEPAGEWMAVIVIVAVACAFIAFITYLIATGEGK
jgi:hypothetical protein